MTPSRYGTLIEMLAARARDDGGRAAFVFEEAPGHSRPSTFGEMWESIERFAALLLDRGLAAGERAVVALPNGGEFFAAFYGVMRAGGVAVPIFPGSGPERVASIAGLCGARFVVVPSAAGAGELERSAAGWGFEVLRPAASAGLAAAAGVPSVAPDDVAYIQYTSGSTGNPKGVQLSHRNLLVNVAQLIAGFEITPREVFVSWLPVYHDMGLVLKTMVPFYLAAKLVLLPTSLRNVRRWIEAIERHRGTFTAAPDFAYRLCLRYVRDPGRFDLRSLRVALNAAEPVRERTLADFEAAFGLEKVMSAGYGLAEATVGVSSWPPGTAAKVDGRGFVSIGRPFPGVEIEIDAGPGEIGEILVKSPANTGGYYNNPRETARLLRPDGFLSTGDLGYRDGEGDLFIVGRKKNIIIHGGESVSPQEIEEAVDETPGLRYSAAVGVDRGRTEGEQVYVFAEVRLAEVRLAEVRLAEVQLAEVRLAEARPADVRSSPEVAESRHRALAAEIVDRIHRRLGFRPGRVYLLKPHAIPLTHNGKLQHARLRDRYLDGSLRREGRILFPDY